MVGYEDVDGRFLHSDAVTADFLWIGSPLSAVELELVVLNEKGPAVRDVVEQPMIVRTQIFPASR